MIQWGRRDYSRLCPLLQYSLEAFDHEVYNIMYHLKQQRSEVLSWSSTTRQEVWKLHLQQLDFEKKSLEEKK